MIVYEILYALICVVFAKINANWIKEGKTIKHLYNGVLHIFFAVIGGIVWAWPVSAIILCNTRVIFDVSLNLFRGLPIDYIPMKAASIVDRAERAVFKTNGYLPKIIYILLSIVFHFYYFKHYQ